MSQLPPLPEPENLFDPKYFDAEGKPVGWLFTAFEMRAYAEQARADLLADAMRWRWLRDDGTGKYNGEYLILAAHNPATPTHEVADYDAAIDAAMKGQA